MAISDEDMGRILEIVERTDKKVHDIEVLLRGNGGMGLVIRTDRLERDAERGRWYLRVVTGGTIMGVIYVLRQVIVRLVS